jgi:hypothetical protein
MQHPKIDSPPHFPKHYANFGQINGGICKINLFMLKTLEQTFMLFPNIMASYSIILMHNTPTHDQLHVPYLFTGSAAQVFSEYNM